MLSIVPFSVLLRRFDVGQWFDISLYSCDPLQDMPLPHHHKQLVIKTMKKRVFPASSLPSQHGTTEQQDEPGD